MADHLLLVGMMGAGKTTTGQELARRLDRPFFDSDVEVERATGRGVAELWSRFGEAGFRGEEASALARAVGSPRPAVISVAGGAVLDPSNRSLIRTAGTVVWLRAPVATLAARVGDGSGRPLLGADPPTVLARLEAERWKCYEAVADAVVDVDNLEPSEVVERVLAAARPEPADRPGRP